MAKRKAITFKHINGAMKFIPGVANKNDLAPRLIQETEMTVAGVARPVLRLDKDFVAKIVLFDEETDARLTETEKKYPEAVQNAIQAKRAEQATLAIEANHHIREAIRSYESQGGIKVLDWNLEIDTEEERSKGLAITQLSEIALADFEDRGIEVPDHLKKQVTGGAVAEKAGVIIKGSVPKKNDES